MSFPDAGHAVPSAESGSNIKFSDLRISYINNEGGGGDGDETLNNEEGVLNLSLFRNATFSDVGGADPIPGSGAISIGSHFCGKTFGAEEGEKEGEPEPGGPGEELPP